MARRTRRVRRISLSLKDKLEIAAKFLGIFASIAGGFLWLNTYMKDVNQRLTDRQKETIRYHELYNAEAMIDARETYSRYRAAAFAAAMPTIAKFHSQRQADEEAPKLLRQAMLQQINAEPAKSDIPRIVNFYEQLSVCIDIDMCDANAARQLFKGEAYEIYYLLGDYLEAKRRRNVDYGAGLQRLGYESSYEKGARIAREMKRRATSSQPNG